jgi:hypothetical protein
LGQTWRYKKDLISPHGILSGIISSTSFEIIFSSLRYIITTCILGVLDRAEAWSQLSKSSSSLFAFFIAFQHGVLAPSFSHRMASQLELLLFFRF